MAEKTAMAPQDYSTVDTATELASLFSAEGVDADGYNDDRDENTTASRTVVLHRQTGDLSLAAVEERAAAAGYSVFHADPREITLSEDATSAWK